MGYTHYWYRPAEIPQEQWDLFQGDAAAILGTVQRRGTLLAGGDGTGSPVARDGVVSFNGIRLGGQDHETFAIERAFEPSFKQLDKEGRLFDFCKTAAKPYDLAVVACLVAFKQHVDNVVVRSDGEDVDWLNGRELCQELFGYGMPFVFGDDGCLKKG